MSAHARAAAAAFSVGLVLMLALDTSLSRIAGVALIFAGIVLGVFAIATPAFTQEED